MEEIKSPALVVVDMQKYYLLESSDYYRYFNFIYPGSLMHIITRAYSVAVPNIQKLISFARQSGIPVVFFRLCSSDPDRKDLHRFFRESHESGLEKGFAAVYPMCGDTMADVIDQLEPGPDDIIINKTTFSPFTSTDVDSILKDMGIETLVFTGLATSQCVETSARDASERGYHIVQIHNAQADYDDMTHNASLFSSRGVCGGLVYDADEFIEMMKCST